MDKERMKEVVSQMHAARIEVIRCQYEIAEELLHRDEIMDAIDSGLVKPCIPMQILKSAARRHTNR